jgi:hypothetical protein
VAEAQRPRPQPRLPPHLTTKQAGRHTVAHAHKSRSRVEKGAGKVAHRNAYIQGGFDPNKSTRWGTMFRLLFRSLPGTNKRHARKLSKARQFWLG